MERQKQTDKQNHKKGQVKDPARRKPGSSGKGHYYHVEVRSGEKFVNFRTQEVSRRGQIQRVAGQRFSGYWTTVKWLIGKEEAHVQDAKLVPDTKAAKEVIQQLGSQPVHWIGDRFRAKPDPNAPESTELTVNRKVEGNKKAPTSRRKKSNRKEETMDKNKNMGMMGTDRKITCEVCGNTYDKSFEVRMAGETHVFDCFECAIHALAPTCAHCDCRIIGHGMETEGVFYCCAHCASQHGIHQFEDRVEERSAA